MHTSNCKSLLENWGAGTSVTIFLTVGSTLESTDSSRSLAIMDIDKPNMTHAPPGKSKEPNLEIPIIMLIFEINISKTLHKTL